MEPLDDSTPPAPMYLSAAPTSNGNISGQDMQAVQATHSLYQLQVNPDNPNQGALLPAPGADAQLSAHPDTVLTPAYRMNGMPKPGQEFIQVEKPTLVERIGDNWKISEMGSVKFSDSPAPELNVFGEAKAGTAEQIALTSRAEQLAGEVATTTGSTQAAAEAELESVVGRADQGPDAGRATYADELRGEGRAELGEDQQDGAHEQQELRNERNKELAAEAKSNREAEQVERAEEEQARIEAERRMSAGDTRPLDELVEEVLGEMQWAAANKASQAAYGPQDEPQQAPAAGVTPATEAPSAANPVGELLFSWKQQGDEVAPLLEMRAYMDQLKDSGVAVGALKFERGEDGKLGGSFGVSYDPASNRIGQLEGAIQGFKQVGNGLDVVEKPEQAQSRREAIGYDASYEPQRSQQVREAFDVKQWDSLSAQLSSVPKTALSAPEQAQQAAGTDRVQQIARQKGTSEEVTREAKSLLDIDTSGNPASAFLKNFYAHLTGGAKTRQNVEPDFERTRQELQARLTKQAGNTEPLAQVARPEVLAPSMKAMENNPKLPDSNGPGEAQAGGIAPKPDQSTPTQKFSEADVPQQVLESLGISAADLKNNGQLQKLLNGEKTDLLKMQVAGKDGQEPVSFEGKMVLHREADGTATLKMDLPKKQLEIPNEIGGQPFTPEQRQRLETEGTAGLMRGLKDSQGKEFNGYVGVDKTMNKLVVLPEDRVKLTDTIAGVKLSPEQSHDLREGKAVKLQNMDRGDGGKPFDGTAQIHAAKAGVEVKPAAHELELKNAPKETQTRDLNTSKSEPEKVKVRGPRM